MLGKSKKIFLPFFVIFGLFFIVRTASASWVANLAAWIVTRPFSFLVWLLAELAIFLSGLAGSLLNWVLSPSFTTLSYTNPAGNIIIDTGLGITRGFVNMLLVLVLVYIAIATILRLAGYETKKLLVAFIIVALLVNFSPVICGLIVDASNIVMNFFVQDLKADAFGKSMGGQLRKIMDYSWETPWQDIISRVIQTAIVSGLLFVLIFVLLTFTIIFILRYLAIWVLVILSPLAFVCYILPITKKYWDLWWKQLFAWSFIGVTCGFFLYLGLLFVTHVPVSITAPTTGEGALFDSILPFFIPGVFLGIGVIFGLQTAAMGASTVIGFAKTKGRATVRRGGRAGRWIARQGWKGIRRHAEDKLRTKEIAGRITQRVEKWKGIRWFLPEAFRRYAEFRPAVDAEMKRLDDIKSRELAYRVSQGDLFGKEAFSAMMVLINRGDMQDLVNAYKVRLYGKEKAKKISDEELFRNEKFRKAVNKPVKAAFSSGYQSKFLRSDPRFARIAAGKKWAFGYTDLDEKRAVTKAVEEARPQHVTNWEREVAEDPLAAEAMVVHWEKPRFNTLSTALKRGRETFLRAIDKNFSNWVDENFKAEAKKLEALDKQIRAETDLDKIEVLKEQKIKMEEPLVKTYEKYLKKTYNVSIVGYYQGLTDPRFKKGGFRDVQYSPKGKEEPMTPSPATAAFEAGEGPPPGAPKRPPTPPPGAPKRKRRVIVTPPPGAPKTPPKKKKIQFKFMITREMRKQLKEKGYTDTDIYKMTPEEAHEILKRSV